MAFPLVFQFFGGNKVLHPFGEAGQASYLDMVFKEGSNLVSMSTLKSSTLTCWKAIAEVPYTSSVVLLLKFLLMLLSVPLKLSRSESRHNPITPKVWPMAFQSYTTVKVFRGKQQQEKENQHSSFSFSSSVMLTDIDFLLQFLPGAFSALGTKSSM